MTALAVLPYYHSTNQRTVSKLCMYIGTSVSVCKRHSRSTSGSSLEVLAIFARDDQHLAGDVWVLP